MAYTWTELVSGESTIQDWAQVTAELLGYASALFEMLGHGPITWFMLADEGGEVYTEVEGKPTAEEIIQAANDDNVSIVQACSGLISYMQEKLSYLVQLHSPEGIWENGLLVESPVRPYILAPDSETVYYVDAPYVVPLEYPYLRYDIELVTGLRNTLESIKRFEYSLTASAARSRDTKYKTGAAENNAITYEAAWDERVPGDGWDSAIFGSPFNVQSGYRRGEIGFEIVKVWSFEYGQNVLGYRVQVSNTQEGSVFNTSGIIGALLKTRLQVGVTEVAYVKGDEESENKVEKAGVVFDIDGGGDIESIEIADGEITHGITEYVIEKESAVWPDVGESESTLTFELVDNGTPPLDAGLVNSDLEGQVAGSYTVGLVLTLITAIIITEI